MAKERTILEKGEGGTMGFKLNGTKQTFRTGQVK